MKVNCISVSYQLTESIYLKILFIVETKNVRYIRINLTKKSLCILKLY